MGDCYFHSVYWGYRGKIKEKTIRHDEIRASEHIGMLIGDDRALQKCINGTTGIFYHEFDLWNKEELRSQLHFLVDEVLNSSNEPTRRTGVPEALDSLGKR